MSDADALVVVMLADAEANPADRAPLAALGDYLSDQEPTTVRLSHVPSWLRLAWMLARRGEHRWGGCAAGWEVLMDLHAWMDAQSGEAGYFYHMDHAGSTVVAGLPCFVSEPYATVQDAREQAHILGEKAGCVAVGLPQGHWNRGTVRVLLFPPLGAPRKPACGTRSAGSPMRLSRRFRGLSGAQDGMRWPEPALPAPAGALC